ncbi:Acid phosphatase [Handroanthus impetiginosus]|uniref:Acid phosphatase n=1 Tax=Handroanthus impetiginosus TaxID=429701 RepID=A0A2G9I7H2_9LAMI|nr:Acid phosphatase [Handroanthus impetiginosus]
MKQHRGKYGLQITLKNYCESWRMNVELHNIRDFKVVPKECVDYIGKYMGSTQYKVDSERTTEECTVYLSTSCGLKKDRTDAWIFDIDDTLLSTVPYYKKNGFGRECLRSATVDNLVDVGYHGWTSLILRGEDDENKDIHKYKADVRKKLISSGYKIWGILGDQWSSIEGLPTAKRSFKLPNPLYYVASLISLNYFCFYINPLPPPTRGPIFCIHKLYVISID